MEKEYLKSQWYFFWKSVFMKETYTSLKNLRYSVHKEGDEAKTDAFEVAFELAKQSKGKRRQRGSRLRTVANCGAF